MSGGTEGRLQVTVRRNGTSKLFIGSNGLGSSRSLIVRNPNCPECHGTGIYRGGLHGDSSPCSLCNAPEIPFGEGVTAPPVSEEIVIQPPGWDCSFLRDVWREAWRVQMGSGSVIPIEHTGTTVGNEFGYVAWRHHLTIATRGMIPISKVVPGETANNIRKCWDFIHALRAGVKKAYYEAVWRTAPSMRYTPCTPDTVMPDYRSNRVTEMVCIHPDPTINKLDVTFHYYAQWVNR